MLFGATYLLILLLWKNKHSCPFGNSQPYLCSCPWKGWSPSEIHHLPWAVSNTQLRRNPCPLLLVSASLGNISEMQVLRPHPRLTEWETLGWGQQSVLQAFLVILKHNNIWELAQHSHFCCLFCFRFIKVQFTNRNIHSLDMHSPKNFNKRMQLGNHCD